MLVQLVNKKVFIDELLNYSKVIARGKLTKSIYDLILETYNIFKNDIVEKIYYIECEQAEIDNLVREFISSFSWDKHLCICSFIGRTISVDNVEILKECCTDSQFYFSFPSYVVDNKIRMYISYYQRSKGKEYDIDYAVNTIFD